MIVAPITLVAPRAFASIGDVGSLRPDQTRCQKCSLRGTSDTGKVHGACDIQRRQNHPTWLNMGTSCSNEISAH